MVSIIGCTGLGVFCVVLAVVLDNKVDQSISKLFFCLGIFALTTATLFVVTDDAGNDWMSGVIVVLLILALSAKPNQRMGKHL